MGLTYTCKSNIHGRGIFAKSNISCGEIIEHCPVIEIPAGQIPDLKKTNLINYYFLWGDDLSSGAIAFGNGSLYNHSYTPNATFIIKIKEQIIEIKAIKEIEKDKEITINYNGDPSDVDPLVEHYNIESIKLAEN